jgi:hypothetical protein
MEDILSTLSAGSYKRFTYSEKVTYDRNQLCIFGTTVYTSLVTNNIGHKPYEPLYWMPVGKVYDPTLSDGIPDGTLLTQSVGGEKNYIVVQSIDGQKYIRVNII